MEDLTLIYQMFNCCSNLTYIDLRNLIASMYYDITLIFFGLPDTGTFIYDSSKTNNDILKAVPKNWNKTDVKN